MDSATGGPGSLVVLGLQNDETTVHLNVGQRVLVELSGNSTMGWHQPTSDGSAIVRRVAFGGFPTNFPAVGLFVAVRPGAATISAQSDAACFYSQPPCLIPVQLWRVSVLVG
ncbi:MAG TPA: hypothetical protein VG317_09185 [Pseudonocardiaceae bacterium]|nr:hypothetical protein [Pseudonocardiaceae bacterium]